VSDCHVAQIRIAAPDDALALGSMHVASWRETYTGLLPDKMLASLVVEARANAWAKIMQEPATELSTVIYLAEQQGTIIGFASCGAQRTESLKGKGYDGEISGIYVLREFQKRKIGVIVRSIDYSALRASPFATAQGRPFGRSPARRAVVGSHAIYAAVLQGRSNGIERIPRPRFREASRARTPGSSSPGECTTHERPTRRRMAGLELLIGYTGLGNLLVLLDREEVPEIQKHLIWVGRAARALPREINDAPILERAFLTSEELK